MHRAHRVLDRRSLALHRLVADKLRADPALLQRARSTLERWMAQPTPARPYLEEWQRLIDAGVDECLRVALADSERAAALRQSSPLACLLTNPERFRFLKDWADAA
jgi:hypothetical protein